MSNKYEVNKYEVNTGVVDSLFNICIPLFGYFLGDHADYYSILFLFTGHITLK